MPPELARPCIIKPCIRQLGELAYSESLEKMRAFNAARTADSADEFWVLSHAAVFTRGVSCVALPDANPDAIPVVQSDRGGQMSYHGPGQLIIYCLLDMKRIGIGPKRLINVIEQAIINLLAELGLLAERKDGAPGVYIGGKKIAALGLRIRKGCCYHGLSINVDADLRPFALIDPCGYRGLAVTSLKQQGIAISLPQTASKLCGYLKDLIYSRTT